MRRTLARGCLGSAALVVALILSATAFVYVQAKRAPTGRPVYVALGSSFAAGPALGSLQSGSPLLCARTEGNYPRRLARLLRLPLVDRSCGGATTAHVLRGGQFFQPPQVDAVNRETRLVTVTVGGNDVGYVGDLSLLAARRSDGPFGWVVRRFWSGPAETRDYARLHAELVALIRAARARAPAARIVVATYPAILPPRGTCARLGLAADEVASMRVVAARLAATTRAAAAEGGATLVDMDAIGAAHHACAAVPWTNGQARLLDAPFHPTAAGAEATARAIAAALKGSPAAVPAVGEDDAAGHQAGRVRR